MSNINIEIGFGKEKAFENWLTPDFTRLHLSYYNDDNFDGCKTSSYDELFDKLNLYDTLQILTIGTDFINILPPNVLKFKKLKSLTVIGSRWCDLNMTQIPPSVERIVLVDQTNLSYRCLIGMEKLVNLKELYLDYSAFNLPAINDPDYLYTNDHTDVPADQVQLVQIPNLSIYLVYNMYVKTNNFISGWEFLILDHYLFKNMKIKSISELNGNIKIILN